MPTRRRFAPIRVFGKRKPKTTNMDKIFLDWIFIQRWVCGRLLVIDGTVTAEGTGKLPF
jgi:hypothetical protein